MSIEHNHDEAKRKKIKSHLEGYGYRSIAHRNDDLFYNNQHLTALSGNNHAVPEEVQRNVIDTYKLREF